MFLLHFKTRDPHHRCLSLESYGFIFIPFQHHNLNLEHPVVQNELDNNIHNSYTVEKCFETRPCIYHHGGVQNKISAAAKMKRKDDAQHNARLHSMAQSSDMRKRLREYMTEEGMLQPPSSSSRLHVRQTALDPNHSDVMVLGTDVSNMLTMLSNRVNNSFSSIRAWFGFDDNKLNAAATIAQRIHSSNLRDDNTHVRLLVDILEAQANAVTPFDFDGWFNMDASSAALINNGFNTFTVEYLESLKSTERFIEFPAGFFMSMGAFVDMARCPILFCIDDELIVYFCGAEMVVISRLP